MTSTSTIADGVAQSAAPQWPTMPTLRIGEGWDCHALVPGRPLLLGGVAVPHTHGLLGHSDADVLLHAAAGFELVNVDCTVVAQAPKLAPYMDRMVQRMAALLGVHRSQVNVKAKTAERLGPVGQGLSMEARAVVLLSGVGVAAGVR